MDNVVAALAESGYEEVVGGTPNVLGKTNASEFEVMTKVIKDLGITAE